MLSNYFYIFEETEEIVRICWHMENISLGECSSFNELADAILDLYETWSEFGEDATQRAIIGGIDKKGKGYCLMIFKGHKTDLFAVKELLDKRPMVKK